MACGTVETREDRRGDGARRGLPRVGGRDGRGHDLVAMVGRAHVAGRRRGRRLRPSARGRERRARSRPRARAPRLGGPRDRPTGGIAASPRLRVRQPRPSALLRRAWIQASRRSADGPLLREPVRAGASVRLDDLPAIRSVPVVTAAQMAEADRVASEELGIALAVLMENASRQVAAAARALLGAVGGERVIALAGSGNNGGDALGAARHLLGWGADARVALSGAADRPRELARPQHDILVKLGVPIASAAESGAGAIGEELADAGLVLDGLLGYSVSGAPHGAVAELIAAAERSGVPVLAIDLPSGLDPDDGMPLGTAIAARATVTLALPKLGLTLPPARRYVGELLLADIGIPAKAYARFGIDARRVFASGDLVRVNP